MPPRMADIENAGYHADQGRADAGLRRQGGQADDRQAEDDAGGSERTVDETEHVDGRRLDRFDLGQIDG
ncbi:hypothetical protein D3C87_2061000 [compost metagenome]